MSRSVQLGRIAETSLACMLGSLALATVSGAQDPSFRATSAQHVRSVPINFGGQPDQGTSWTIPYEIHGSAQHASARGVATSVAISLHRGSLSLAEALPYANILNHFADAVFEATEGTILISDIQLVLDGQPSLGFGDDTANIVWLPEGVPVFRTAGGIGTRGGHIVMFDVFDQGNLGQDLNFLADATTQRQGGYILAALWLQYFLSVGAEFAVSGGDIPVAGSVLADPFTPSTAGSGVGLNMSATLDGISTSGVFDLHEHTRATPQHRLYGLSALATVAQTYGQDPKSSRLFAKRPRTFFPTLAAAAGPADMTGPATNLGSLPGGVGPGSITIFDDAFFPIRIASENTLRALTPVNKSEITGCTIGQGLLDILAGEPVILEFPADTQMLNLQIDIYDFPFIFCFDGVDDVPNLNITITDPLGRPYNPVLTGPGFTSYQIGPSIPGPWQIMLEARAFDSRNIAIDVFTNVITAPTPIAADIVAAPGDLASDFMTYPTPMVIQVNPTFGLGIAGATVNGILTLPSGSRSDIEFKDDGRSPDLIAGDGSYATFVPYNQDGDYVVEVVGFDFNGAARVTYTGTSRAPRLTTTGPTNPPATHSLLGEDVMRGNFFVFTVVGNDNDDHGNTFLESLLDLPAPFTNADVLGKIDTPTDVDYYRFMTPAGRGTTVDTVMRVTSVSRGGTPILRIFAPDGTTEIGRGAPGPSGYLMRRLDLNPSTQYFAVVEPSTMTTGDTYSFSVGRPITSDTGSFGVGRSVAPGGSGGGGGGGGGCFIATAAYGTPLEREIDALRAARDAHLLTNSVGAAFSDAYYRISPPIAAWVAQNNVARAAVRAALNLVLHPAWIVMALALLALGAGVARTSRLTLARIRRK